jgi:NADH-quinone oxidoreductase subunit M
VLALTAALLGVYVALDAVLFFAFWELGLSPTLLLLGLWGSGAARRRIATRVLVTLLLGGVPLLAGLVLAVRGDGGWQTDLVALAASPPAPAAQGAIAALLLLGLAVKAPLPPFHGWMPETMGEGPAPLGALVVGFKIGAWGLLRLLAPLAPSAFAELAPWLGAWAVGGAAYAGLVALRQPSLRRLVAWLGVSHVGIVVLAIASREPSGVQGALLALAHFPLASSALVLLAGWLHDRLRTEDLAHLGGIAARAPRFAALLVLGLAAAAGLPGTSGFVGELLALVSAFRAWPVAGALAVVALAFGVVAVVRAGAAILGGRPAGPGVTELRDATGAESAPVLMLLAVSVLLGLVPSVPLVLTEGAVAATAADRDPTSDAVRADVRRDSSPTRPVP